MDKMEQLNSRLAELHKGMSDIIEKAQADTGGQLSQEQRESYDKLEKEYDEKLAERDELQRDLDRQKRAKERADRLADIIPPRETDHEPLSPDNTSGGGRIIVKEKKFLSLGDQLQAIARVAKTGHDDPMLEWEQLAPATGSAQSGVPSDGGYLVQKDFVVDLMRRMDEERSLPPVRPIPIGPNSDGLKLTVIDETSRATGSRWGGVQVYWGAEADAATAKKPKFRVMELELRDLIGLAYATNRLLNDASALEAVFLQAFAEEMNWERENARINGTGAGQPRGILSTTGATATISVAKEVGQAATTVTFNNVVDMWSRMWARGRSKAVWLINQDVEPSLQKMKFDVGTGGVPAYLPPGALSQSPYGSLMGRPVIPVEYCQTLGTKGDIILWDPTQYIEIEKGGMQADQSIHVRFTTNENTFRFITRVDGQPLWNSALTPANGSTTHSPQVVLADRT